MSEKIIDKSINDIISESFIDYAREVIENRALPDIRDGLKPVQRRILFAMKDLGLWHNKPFRKCARIVGDVLGKLHPHGDSSVYNALVNLAQPFNRRYILIEGQGNFGTVDDGPAAMRYTEARLSALAEEMLKDLDKDTVEWKDNFDDTLKEPTVLPSLLPNLLLNGTTGIAVGIASNIPPHNLGEVVDGICAYIDNPKITNKELLQHIKGPDFPTGGIVSPDGLAACYQRGTGAVKIRSRVNIEELPNNKRQLVITEIPYQVSKSSLIEKIVRHIESRSIDDVLEIRDESNQNGLRIVIEMDKGGQAEKLLDELYKKTPLQTRFNYNMVALVDGKPETLSLQTMIAKYVEHKIEVIRRRCEYDLKKAKARDHILDGLIKAVDMIDEIIVAIKKSATPKAAKENLIKKFGFTEPQAQAILDIRLQRLTALEINVLKKEKAELEKLIKKLTTILSSEKNIMTEIKKELLYFKEQYADERLTTIKPFDKIEIKTKIEKFTLQISDKGKVKKLSENYSGDRGLTLKTDSTKTILLFTAEGNVIKWTGLNIPQSVDEEIVGLCNEDDYSPETNVVFFTSDGLIKKSALKEYLSLKQTSLAVKLSPDAKVVNVKFVLENNKEQKTLFTENDIILFTKNGYAIRFEDNLRQVGRIAAGVRGIKLDDEDEVVAAVVLPATISEGQITLETETEEKKVVEIPEIRKQNRGGKGVNIQKTGKIKGVI